MKTIPYSHLDLPRQELKHYFTKEIEPYVPTTGMLGYAASLCLRRAMGRYHKDIKERGLTIVNAYYDIVINAIKTAPLKGTVLERLLPGCTAFAYDTPAGPIHGRNLDWPSPDNMLAEEATQIKDRAFTSVGWKGLDACYTGMREGAFSVSLNAVVSEEGAGLGGLAAPIAVKTALDKYPDYKSAVEYLSRVKLLADCLIMVVGTKKSEMCVIERTPRKARVRGPEKGLLVVTNDYKVMPNQVTGLNSDVAMSSCGRYDRTCEIALDADPFEVLQDSNVMMGITTHHTVMSAATGYIESKQAL